MLLLLVPAAAAVELTKRLYQRTWTNSEGLWTAAVQHCQIFFPKHCRCSRYWTRRGGSSGVSASEPEPASLAEGPARILEDHRIQLGTEAAFAPPYFRTAEALTDEPSYFETLIGPVAHMTHSEAGRRSCAQSVPLRDAERVHGPLPLVLNLDKVPDSEDLKRDELWRITTPPEDAQEGRSFSTSSSSALFRCGSVCGNRGSATPACATWNRHSSGVPKRGGARIRPRPGGDCGAGGSAVCALLRRCGDAHEVLAAIRDGLFFRT